MEIASLGSTGGVSSAGHQAFLRWAAESQERLAVNLEREGRADYAERAWVRDAAQKRAGNDPSRDGPPIAAT